MKYLHHVILHKYSTLSKKSVQDRFFRGDMEFEHAIAIQHRHNEPQRIYHKFMDQTQPSEAKTSPHDYFTIVAPAQAAQPSMNLNKPLPPLPIASQEFGKGQFAGTRPASAHQHVRRRLKARKSSTSSFTSVVLRWTLGPKRRRQSTTQDGSVEQVIPCAATTAAAPKSVHFPSTFRQATKPRQMSQALPSASSVSVPVQMLDQGVQTMGDMSARAVTQTLHSPPGLDAVHFAEPRRPSQRYISNKIPKTPIPHSSTQVPWKTLDKNVTDYFCFPPDERCNWPKNHRSSDNVSPGRVRKTSSPRSMRAVGTPSSIGTYESRYPDDNSTIVDEPARPEGRRTNSDLTTRAFTRPIMQDRSRSDQQSSTTKSPLITSAEEAAKRIILRPRGMLSGRRSMAQSSDSAGAVSPLRQQMIPPRDDIGNSVEAQVFRASVGAFSPDLNEQRSAYLLDIPDHLRSSPLCPLHPKNQSKRRGDCPLHGRSSIAADSDESPASIRAIDRHHSETHDEGATPIEKQVNQFKLKMPVHSAYSLECPANPNHPSGKGICILHGRGHGDAV